MSISSKEKQSGAVIVIITVLLSVLGFVFYSEYEDTKIERVKIIEKAKQDEANLNKTIYSALKSEAEVKTMKVANEIRNQLIDEYGNDNERFTRDYNDMGGTDEITTISHDIITNKYNRYFHVETDSNDFFLLDKEKVRVDGSGECAVEEDIVRFFENEIPNHFNRQLATQAFEEIAKARKLDLFWQYRTIKNEKVEITDIKDIDKVLSLPLEKLRTYEFLTYVHIDKDKDLMGNAYVTPSGKIDNDANRLVLVLGFNLYEQAQDRFKSGYDLIQHETEKELELLEVKQRNLAVKVISIMGLVFVSFFSISSLHNSYLNTRGEENGTRHTNNR